MEKIIPKDGSEYARYMIGKARLFMFRAREKELKPYNVSPRQANILYIIYNYRRQISLSELAWHSDRKINTLSILMTRMERDGLVKKIRKTPNSTILKFELTKKGMDTYKRIIKSGSVKAIMSILSDQEQKQLVSMLERIVNAAELYH